MIASTLIERAVGASTGTPMLAIHLARKLSELGVRYSHWKSNMRLDEAIAGKADLDLLIARADASRFEGVLQDLGFRRAVSASWDTHPWVHHFYGLDPDTGRIVHVHAAYRLLTGGGLVKNYHFPIEELLLQTAGTTRALPTPSTEVELVVFVLRKSVEQGSLAEWFMLAREGDSVAREAEWLAGLASERGALDVLREWFASVDPEDFKRALHALRAKGASSLAFYLSAKRIRWQLRRYRLRNRFAASVVAACRLGRLAWRRLFRRGQTQGPIKGGCIIAFVGSDGAGKSTLLSQTEHWLGRELNVQVVHTGKPPATLLSALPRLFLPALRVLFPKVRVMNLTRESAGAEVERDTTARPASLMALVRSVLIAHDQRAIARQALRMASRGAIVLCDRYPSARPGGMDGPRADPDAIAERHSFRRRLASAERRIYASMPQPDLAFYLDIPLDVALERNASRTVAQGRDDESSIRERYELVRRWHIPYIPLRRLDSTKPVSELCQTVRETIWQLL